MNQNDVQKYIDDYGQISGKLEARFVCPITLKSCEPDEVIAGHILNKAIRVASRKTVPQFREIDNFYGTRVEPDFVQYINFANSTSADVLRASRNILLKFADGSTVRAFPDPSRSASDRFPELTLERDGVVTTTVFAEMSKDDPRLDEGNIETISHHQFHPSHLIASLLKSAYLTLFLYFGYAITESVWGNDLRTCLFRYYKDNASKRSTSKYFRYYEHAVKVIFSPHKIVDSLDGGRFFFHYTPADTLFATTFLFHLNGFMWATTVPYSIRGTDPAIVLNHYERYLANGPGALPRMRRVEFNGKELVVEQSLSNVKVVAGSEVRAFLKKNRT